MRLGGDEPMHPTSIRRMADATRNHAGRRQPVRRIGLKLLTIVVLTVAVSAPISWGTENGYCYIVSYSDSTQTAYFTPVFVAPVSGETYSKEEFVADVGLIRKMQAEFQAYLTDKGLSASDFVTSAREAYRSQAIADKRLADEKSDFKSRGYTIKMADDFTFKD
jgi:hypothetical protein